MLHRVNKLQFETTCTTEAQAFELRHSISETCQQQVADVIDKICSQYVSEDEWIKIDKLEIDLGNFNIDSFEKKFTAVFLTKFEKEISKLVSNIPAAEKKISKQVSALELLKYFLQTGSLPWWADDETVNINTVFTEVLEQQQLQFCNFLEQHRFTPAVWQRMALQLNEQIQKNIIPLFSKLAAAKNKIIGWTGVILGQNINSSDEINIDGKLLQKIHLFVLYNAPVFFTGVKENLQMLQLIKEYTKEFAAVIHPAFSIEEAMKKIIAYEKQAANDNIAGQSANEVNEKMEENISLITNEEILPEKFTVHTAGLVLLAPYLKQLFTHLNLLVKDEWKNKEANYKAIHLVRYLATGQQQCPEYSLVVEKLLCGMEISAPIPGDVLLTEGETAEATELLKAVISNWVKLKNTSVDGLRETFLKRDGMLKKKENSWLLQVERKTADVLLESVPWGFSTLAFSWNNYIIFTEW